MIRCEMKKILLIIICIFSSFSIYADEIINNDCKPNGAINNVKAIYSPKKFWVQALNVLDHAVTNLKQSNEYDQLVSKNNVIRENLEIQEEEKLGIELYKPTEEDKKLDKETEDLIEESQNWIMEATIKWVEKCRPYVIKKIESKK